jgi:primosomal protein N' (replication factor Y)
MHARVIIVGQAGKVEQLTYVIPPALEGRVACGHRVLVPMRSRRMTGLVVELGEDLDAGGTTPKAILELLESRPLFDRAHLQLIEFLASYYMAPLGEAYRSVIPAIARVESRRLFKLGRAPDALALATLTPLERVILDSLARRPLSARQIRMLGDPAEADSALAHLIAEGLVEASDATRGRHRATTPSIVRLVDRAGQPLMRGRVQREIHARLTAANSRGLALAALEEQFPSTRAILRTMVHRGIAEIITDDSAASLDDASDTDSKALNNYPIIANGALPTNHPGSGPDFDLTWEQKAAINEAAPAIRERRGQTFLLWGVTASGKTEIYLQLAAVALAAGRQVMVLVPEIALADQVVKAFSVRFGRLVGVAHSGQNVSERWTNWMDALSGRSRIMIGPRSAVFAPLNDPGLIVVDEEHDTAYKQEEGIRYNARDLAVALGRFSNAPVILGSATPSAESYANARRGRYRMIRLANRAGTREFAEVEVIDLRDHQKKDAHPSADSPPLSAADASPTGVVPLTPPLIDALRANLAAGGQSVVFLNRRGYHNFLQCHLCGNVIACRDCSVSLTFHLRDRTIRCHYCGANSTAPEQCPACNGYGLEGQGYGTERLADALAELLPTARIERMDSDTSGRRGARAAIVDALKRGEIDILAGTQMITKGFDFPGVTLVGVVMADLALNLPDFRSAERTFQLLTQVAGRAGRGDKPGRVLIQTYAPHHYSIRAARDQDYARFMRRELELRREMMYPPYARLAMVRIEGEDPARVAEVAAKVASILAHDAKPGGLRVLGPAPAPIERIKRRFRWQVMVKSTELKELRTALAMMRTAIALIADRSAVRLMIDIDPINML